MVERMLSAYAVAVMKSVRYGSVLAAIKRGDLKGVRVTDGVGPRYEITRAAAAAWEPRHRGGQSGRSKTPDERYSAGFLVRFKPAQAKAVRRAAGSKPASDWLRDLALAAIGAGGAGGRNDRS